MSSRRRPRLLVPALLLVGLVLVGAIGVWLTWPVSWTPQTSSTESGDRVGRDERPRWARRPRLGPPSLDMELPPASRVAFEAEEAPTGAEDTGSEAFGPATITGWLVDSRGRDVGEGTVRARCTLVDEDGEFIGGAGGTGAMADDNGYFELSVSGPAQCLVSGMRRDGLLNAFSESVELWIEPGEELSIDLIVPAARTGGIGVSFRGSLGGARIVRVHEGTPAWDAGLRPGDLIVAVDGEPTGELEDSEFVELMTGPEGSEVDFTVSYEEDGEVFEEVHRVERRFLDRDLIR